MTSGLWLADTIYQDLAVIGDSQFDWWTALSSQLGCDPVVDADLSDRENTSGWNDGLLYYDPNFRTDGNHSIYTTKRYWVLGNFSRYVRPGAVRHQVTERAARSRRVGLPGSGQLERGGRGQRCAGRRPATRLRLALPAGSDLRSTGAFETSATSGSRSGASAAPPDRAGRAPGSPAERDHLHLHGELSPPEVGSGQEPKLLHIKMPDGCAPAIRSHTSGTCT